MKETAVEWLYGKWSEQGTLYFSDLNQAKAMEKKQIMDAYIESGANLEDIIKEAAEDYYNKQFKIN